MSQTDNPTWSLEQLSALLRHTDAKLAVWATDRIPLLAERDALARWLTPGLEHADGKVQRAVLFELRERRVPLDAGLDALRTFVDRDDADAEARLEALALLSRTDTDAATKLAAALDEGAPEQEDEAAQANAQTPAVQPTDPTEGVWPLWAELAPEAARASLEADDRLPAELDIEQLERYEAFFAVATPDDAKRLVDWMAEVEEEEDFDALAAVLLDHLAGRRFLQHFDQPIDSMVRLTERGLPGDAWATLAGRLRTRLFKMQGLLEEDEDDQAMQLAIGWLREDLGQAPELMPGRAWYQALVEALSDYQQDTDPWLVELSASLMLSLGWTSSLYANFGKKGELEALLNGWIASSGAVADALYDRLRKRWGNASPESRQDILGNLEAMIREGGLGGMSTERIERLGALDGLDRARLARAWLELLVNREEEVRSRNALTVGAHVPMLVQLLAAEPELLREQASELLPRGTALRTLLPALAKQPGKWAGALMLEHADALASAPDEPALWPALLELADPAWQQRVVTSWREGEWEIAAVAERVAAANGERDVLDKALTDDALRYHGWTNAMEQAAQAIEEGKRVKAPLRVRLRCTACQKPNSVQVPVALYAPAQLRTQLKDHIPAGWDGFMLNRVVECHYCEALDEYALLPESAADIVRKATENANAQQKFTNAPDELGAFIALSRLADGTVVTRASQLLEKLRAAAEAKPKDAVLWRQLGNASHRFGRDSEAVEAWVTAVELDQTELEAAFSVAMWLLRETGPEEAREAVLESVRRIPRARGKTNDELRANIARQSIVALSHVYPHIPEGTSLVTTWAIRAQNAPPNATPQVGTAAARMERIKRWDILAGIVLSKDLAAIDFTQEPPEQNASDSNAESDGPGGPVQLEALLAGEIDPAAAQQQQAPQARKTSLTRRRKKKKR